MARPLASSGSLKEVQAELETALLPGKRVLSLLAAAGIGVVAVGLRWYGIAAKSIWVDEASSIGIARLGWHDFFLIVWHREINMAAYLLVLRSWLLLGDKQGFVRGLSLLFSVLTVPIVYALGKRLFGSVTGLLAAWLLALNAYHIRYAQEARSYAMVVFLVFAATLLLVRNLQEPEKAHWWGYVALCVLAVYTHLFAGFYVLSHLAALCSLRGTAVDWPAIRKSFLGFAVCMLPLGGYFLSRGTESVDWLPSMNFAAILGFLVTISGNNGWWLVALQGIVLAALGYTAWSMKGKKQFNLGNWGYLLMPSMFLIPVMVTCGISLFKPFFLGRYLNPCVPAWCLLVAAGLTKFKPAVLGALLTVAISVFSFLGVVSYYQNDFDLYRGDWRSASNFIFDQARPGDDVFYLNFLGMPLEYYRSQRDPPAAWPRSLTSEDGNLHYKDFLRLPIAERLMDSRPVGRRVWLTLWTPSEVDRDPTNQFLRAYFGTGRKLMTVRRFDFISVFLYEREETTK